MLVNEPKISANRAPDVCGQFAGDKLITVAVSGLGNLDSCPLIPSQNMFKNT